MRAAEVLQPEPGPRSPSYSFPAGSIVEITNKREFIRVANLDTVEVLDGAEIPDPAEIPKRGPGRPRKSEVLG